MPNKHWDILGIGTVAVDDLLYVDHYPIPNEKISIKMKQRQGGGLTATALVAAARQGAKTTYCGRLGYDELSLFTIQELERERVDTSFTQRIAGAKPYHSTVLVDLSSGSRTIIYHNEGVSEPERTAITEEMIASSRVLFIDHLAVESGWAAIGFAHSHGIPVVADVESLQRPDLNMFLKQIDHLIVGSEFANKLTGLDKAEDKVRALSHSQQAACVVTCGAGGCWYCENGGEIFHFPAFSVEVIDTTGCGDVFHGAYAAALARGERVNRAIQVATATAGLKATHPGGREGIPNLETVDRFLKMNGVL